MENSAKQVMSDEEPIILCREMNKWFGDFHVLRNVSLQVMPQEVLVIIGPSGSGKSTFIRCINRLEEHQDGTIIVDGIELSHDVQNIADIRRETGMVFQQFNLFPHLTVMDNISLAPMKVRHWPRDRAEQRAMELLERVGIPEQAFKYPGQLSGGQQQRVAIARALAMDPLIILADEPTGNLDSRSGMEILDLFEELHEAGKTLLMVTHSDELAERTSRRIRLLDGRVESDERMGV